MPRYLPFLVILILGALLGASRATERFDLKLLDLQFRLLRAGSPQGVGRDVVVVGVDEAALRHFPEPIALWHAHLGRFLSAMAVARPAAVGLDIVLPDRSYDAVLPGLDKQLLKGMLDARRAYPLVLGQTVDPSGRPRPIQPLFLKIAGDAGYALFPADRDGVVRRFDERLAEDNKTIPTLAGQLARKLGVAPRPGYLDFWRGAPYNYVPFGQVLEWAEKGDEAALARAFRGKAVLTGMVLPFEDRLRAPVPLAAWEPDTPNLPGVLMHAQALRSLLNGSLVQAVPALAVAAICGLLAALWLVSGATTLMALLLAVVAALLAGASTWLLSQGWHFPAIAPAVTAALALGGRNGYDTLLKLRERRRLRASFGGYVSPSVMDEILGGRIHPAMDGENKFVCVLFSDIRNYTARSERMTPEQVIRFLNRYFERTVAQVHERGGAVVSFMGDGMMAVFGAPKPLDNPCREAFEAARAMLAYVTELNAQFGAEGEEPMYIGIGLHAGEAVIGHVGSSSRHDYSAIGDVTNVASRLESLTKAAGYRLVCSTLVAGHLGATDGLVFLGPMEVKGHSPVEVYGYDKASS